MSTFYNKMKEIRKDADETQKNIANHLQITQEQYSLYETGKRYIPVDLLKAFCDYFKVSADYILGLDPDMDWPRGKGEKRYNSGCTKYIFLYVKIYSNFWRLKSRPFGLLLSLLRTPTRDLPKIVIETRAPYRPPNVVQIQFTALSASDSTAAHKITRVKINATRPCDHAFTVLIHRHSTLKTEFEFTTLRRKT